jgi:2-polyprenyl-6-methoxyphenol hydroxylase-like FAD-dependent oxidoreductase
MGRHAEIAGAGIAGLTTAAVLAQRGWSVRVHERGSELREIGAGIFVWENGIRSLETIGAFEDATRQAELIEHWELRDQRRRLLQGAWMMGGARLYLIRRTDLHRALADAALRAGVEIVTNSTVAHAAPDGELVLEDGRRLRADLVVGADGVYSRLRDFLQLALVVRDLEDGCSRHLVRRSENDPREITIEYWHGGRRIGICPCAPDEVYVYLCCPARDARGRAKPLDRESWIRSFPHLRGAVARIPDEGRWAPFFNVVCRSWSAGSVAIVGDAAHAMSPQLGQGACVAMTNAIALGQALDAYADVPAALQAWERSERPATDATQRYSRIYGTIGISWTKTLLDLRSALVWLIGRSEYIQRKANVAAHHFPSIAAPGSRMDGYGTGVERLDARG